MCTNFAKKLIGRVLKIKPPPPLPQEGCRKYSDLYRPEHVVINNAASLVNNISTRYFSSGGNNYSGTTNHLYFLSDFELLSYLVLFSYNTYWKRNSQWVYRGRPAKTLKWGSIKGSTYRYWSGVVALGCIFFCLKGTPSSILYKTFAAVYLL